MNRTEQLQPIEKYFFLLLFCPGSTSKMSEPIPGKTWLQKEMFFISKNVESIASDAEFQNYLQGAYSDVVDDLLEQFEIDGYVSIKDGKISLTEKGKELAKEIWQSSLDDEKTMVQDVKELLNDLATNELLALAYSVYPEMKIYSSSADVLEANKVKIAISLLRKKKVSLQKAAELAGVKIDRFVELVKQGTK